MLRWQTWWQEPGYDPTILVAQGATRDFNPELPQSIIDKAMDRDPAAASAEYMAQFRTDVEGFIMREAVDACVNLGVHERLPERAHSYVAFVDPSGGSSDAMTLAIAHTEGKTQILDVIRERKPPFSPEAVTEEYAKLVRSYRCTRDERQLGLTGSRVDWRRGTRRGVDLRGCGRVSTILDRP